MKPHIVVDIGNSAVKWGMCRREGVVKRVSLPHHDAAAWERQLALWEGEAYWWPTSPPRRWAVAGVNPQVRDGLTDWLRQQGHEVLIITAAGQLPLEVTVPEPDKVGIDRLLDAVAARDRVRRNVPLAIIDAGTAITVDWVDADGRFQGGAIVPGIRLMARALHEHTALLPQVEITDVPNVLGRDTVQAMHAGIFWAAAGAIKALVRLLGAGQDVHRREVFLTGGDAALLAPVMDPDVTHWPEMTLEGIRIAAEAQQ
jgi:type III pantothenate kinase